MSPTSAVNTFITIGIITIVAVPTFLTMSIFTLREGAKRAADTSPQPTLSYQGEWVPAEFPEGYHHSYTMKVPATWSFGAGGDTDGWSASWVTPGPEGETDPVITVYDYVLIGCPDGGHECSIDEVVRIPADEYMRRTLAAFDKEGFRRTITILPQINAPAYTYPGTSPSDEPTEEYLIQLPTGVLNVQFHNPDQWTSQLKQQFLESIEGNEE